jgi:PAS domain S-box-containing protein
MPPSDSRQMWPLAYRTLFRTTIEDILREGNLTFGSQYGVARLLDDEDPIATDDRASDSTVLVKAEAIDSRGVLRGTIGFARAESPEFTRAEQMALARMARTVGHLLEMRDITLALSEERALLRTIVDEAAVAIFTIRDGRLDFINRRFADALGYTREEVLSLDSVINIVEEAERPRVQEMVRQRADGESGARTYVTEVRRRDGTTLAAEIHGTSASVAGHRIVIGVALDIGKRLSAEQVARQNEEYFRVLTDNIGDIIFIVGDDGRLKYMSAAIEHVLGYTIEERLGQRAFETVHPDDHERLTSFMNALSGGVPFDRAQFRFRHKNGSVRVLELRGTNLLSHPLIRGVMFNAADVTDRSRLEQELEQLKRISSLGRLAAQVAHEFNNVLMGIQAPVDVIRRMRSDNAQLPRLTDLMLSSIARGKGIATDILRFGRPARLTLAAVDVEDLIRQAEAEIRPLLAGGIAFKIEIADAPLFIRGDRAQLAQALINLALNARDAMASLGGTLTIGACAGNHHTAGSIPPIPNSELFVYINVRDTGEGISSEDVPYIFEPLFTTKSTGTGLGLSVVYQVITGHGGHIFVDTRRGSGTEFQIFLPCTVDQRSESMGDAPSQPAGLARVRVLLVEDEVNVATGIKWILETEGLVVQIVARAADVLPAIDDFGPDIVVLDLSLPDGDGRAVYETMSGRDLPVIFSTGSLTAGDLDTSGHGNVAVLIKPYSADDLLHTIGHVLHQRKLH